MAEYIDREKIFHNGVFYVNAENPETSLNELINCICNLPTADVVPKSESEFDSIPVEVAQVLKDKAVEKAKADVAREIFEDFTKHKVCTNEEDFRVLAELKKKYIGEKE